MRPILLTLILFLFGSLTAQEYLSPLSQDLSKRADTKQRLARGPVTEARNQVSLPFVDDFSQDHMTGNADGNEVLWEGLNVSLNQDFAVNPPSIGVAVFDGLDAYGAPYSPSTASNGLADTLTSVEINLSGQADVVMSFYYQPAGKGDSPESNDSLILQFYDTSMERWNRVWHTTGTPVMPFQSVRLAVTEDYLESGFKFRFMNYGRLTGALDQWALDWVYINSNRPLTDEPLIDVCFTQPVSTLLNGKRSSMPYEHFNGLNPSSFMLTSQEVYLRNHKPTGALISESSYTVSRDGSLEGPFIDASVPSIMPLTDDTITHEVNSAPHNFIYPNGLPEESVTYDVEFEFETAPDFHADNNRMSFSQHFADYYAYDDGQADVAYGIQNFLGAGKVALSYQVLQTDTLQAVDMQFLYQAQESGSPEDQLFYLTVWEEGDTGPGEILYQDLQPRFITFDEEGGFVRYNLQDTLVLEENDTYYFGWVQPDNISLNIGNDLSSDINVERLHFDVGFGWTGSSYPGVIMLRPAFEKAPDSATGIDDQVLQAVELWPNPANGYIHITGDFPIGSLATLYDLEGRMVTYERLVNDINTMDLSFTAEGLYLLEISTEQGSRRIEKIVIYR